VSFPRATSARFELDIGYATVVDDRRRRRYALGRVWLILWLMALVWSSISLVPDRNHVINVDGWAVFTKFWVAAVSPDLSANFLRTVSQAAATTIAFAVLGAILSVIVGAILGLLSSEVWWDSSAGSQASRVRANIGWLLTRGALGFPRGVHEAVWGLLLVAVLGRDPIVGILAITIPFGAVTAKVYAEMLDESPRESYDALRVAGGGKFSCVLYGLLPVTLPNLTSFAFYRFDCAIRSAVVLGMVGAGGLGLELILSLRGSQYGQMWTLIYTLFVICACVDRLSSMLRAQPGVLKVRCGILAGAVAFLSSGIYLAPDLSRVFSKASGELFARLLADMWPLHLDQAGWTGLVARSVETFQMSLVAITLGSLFAVGAAFAAARGAGTSAGRLTSYVARALLLFTRAIPPPMWALLVLFVMFPGPLPGAIALAIYNFGILGRLYAEAVENLDVQPREALTRLGAGGTAGFVYATIPAAARQLLSYGLYRWEAGTRETVVVGVVGAGGLGRLLEEQRVGFDYGGMMVTVLALIMVSLVVDVISTVVRKSLR
jgi:phosphonate transport system permease protein